MHRCQGDRIAMSSTTFKRDVNRVSIISRRTFAHLLRYVRRASLVPRSLPSLDEKHHPVLAIEGRECVPAWISQDRKTGRATWTADSAENPEGMARARKRGRFIRWGLSEAGRYETTPLTPTLSRKGRGNFVIAHARHGRCAITPSATPTISPRPISNRKGPAQFSPGRGSQSPG